MNPVVFTNSQFKVLQLIFKGTATESNGVVRNLNILFYYAWLASTGGSAPTATSKTSLVTTATTGFKAIVATPLLAVLNARWTSVGIFARWLDQVLDPFANVSAFTTAGGVGSAATCLPLANHVTVQKNTGMRGKHYRGNWKIPCIDSTYVTKDELNAGTGQVAWAAMKTPLYATITDGTSIMTPCLVSEQLSQLKMAPTSITVAPLGVSGGPACTINASVGENKRRKEKPAVKF